MRVTKAPSPALFVLLTSLIAVVHSFTVPLTAHQRTNQYDTIIRAFSPRPLFTTTNGEQPATFFDDTTTTRSADASPDVTLLKANLLQACTAPQPSKAAVLLLIRQLEATQSASDSFDPQSLSGEWELVYSSDDPTRSSPFFWAFRKAFPDTSDQIFGITDSIPATLKSVGPALQTISYDAVARTGRLVSRVKVSTLGGIASSIMTTRASITGANDPAATLTLRVETTKPEQSSILSTLLGPLGPVINENAPAFPSGAALERVTPGSSVVTMQTSFCDEGLRISYNHERPEEQVFVWRRKEFASYEYL